MRVVRVPGDADENDVHLGERGPRVAKGARFLGAALGLVLRVEVNDDGPTLGSRTRSAVPSEAVARKSGAGSPAASDCPAVVPIVAAAGAVVAVVLAPVGGGVAAGGASVAAGAEDVAAPAGVAAGGAAS